MRRGFLLRVLLLGHLSGEEARHLFNVLCLQHHVIADIAEKPAGAQATSAAAHRRRRCSRRWLSGRGSPTASSSTPAAPAAVMPIGTERRTPDAAGPTMKATLQVCRLSHILVACHVRTTLAPAWPSSDVSWQQQSRRQKPAACGGANMLEAPCSSACQASCERCKAVQLDAYLVASPKRRQAAARQDLHLKLRSRFPDNTK